MVELSFANVIAGIAALVSVISLFRSGKKEQTDLDKEQTDDIKKLQISVATAIEKQNSISERIAAIEGQQQAINSSLAKEIEKIDKKIVSMDQHFRQDMARITEAIISMAK